MKKTRQPPATSGTKRILRSSGNETEKTKKPVGTLSLENGKGGGSYQSTVHVLQHSTQQSSICLRERQILEKKLMDKGVKGP
ncbi:unnamed protein product [Cuscuta campestris]|uniref:Uncharacterized protein n=1 Tax=Cuscuta campestris TaxID=132261 RepID=A0A484KI19_9ASTE|nr:unnamed protein product [Cuscuta campestris]